MHSHTGCWGHHACLSKPWDVEYVHLPPLSSAQSCSSARLDCSSLSHLCPWSQGAGYHSRIVADQNHQTHQQFATISRLPIVELALFIGCCQLCQDESPFFIFSPSCINGCVDHCEPGRHPWTISRLRTKLCAECPSAALSTRPNLVMFLYNTSRRQLELPFPMLFRDRGPLLRS